MATPTPNPELQQLLSLLLDGELSPEDRRRLNEILAGDDSARQYYYACLRMHSMLLWEKRAPRELPVFEPNGVSEPPMPASRRAAWRGIPGRLARHAWERLNTVGSVSVILSGLFITGLLLVLAMWILPPPDRSPDAAPDRSFEVVARIAGSQQARFDAASDGNLRYSALYADDTIVINSGLVVIEYDTGARVVLEGPATYRIQGANGGKLRLGKLVARIDTPESHGFAVDIPGARIVDLGTEFGVEVDADGVSEVVVLAGEVELTSTPGATGLGQSVRLGTGEGASVDAADGKITLTNPAGGHTSVAMARRLTLLGDEPPAFLVAAVPTEFVAFHKFGGRPSPGHTTTQQAIDEVVCLVKHQDGSETGIELTVAGPQELTTRPDGATRPPAADSPAAKLFEDSGLVLDDAWISIGGNSPVKRMSITLSGLDPARRYDVALYGDRDESPDGPELFTLQGADSAENAASSGVAGRFTTRMETRPNAESGHFVRWIDIAPGEDGRIVIEVDAGGSLPKNIAYVSALRLAQQAISPDD